MNEIEDFKIYLPVDVTGKCVEVQSGEVIRVYDDEVPELGIPITFTDFYVNSHYLSVSGSTELDTHAVCIDSNRITNSYTYRFDFPLICMSVFFIIFIIFYIVSLIVKVFFRRVK